MPAYKIQSLTEENLAPIEVLRHPELYEWRDIDAAPGGILETAGLKNLRISCANCGWSIQDTIPPSAQGFSLCPDCSEPLFLAKRLFERKTEHQPNFRIQRSKAGFIHIEGWEKCKNAVVYYTCNGQDPTHSDNRYTRPFKPDSNHGVEIRAVCYSEDTKSQVESMLLQDPCPTISHQCRFCGSRVEGCGERITCPTCGVSLITHGVGPSSEEPPGFTCSSCRSGRLNIGADARLRCESCGAEYMFSNTWNFSCWRIECPVCRKGVALMASESGEKNNFCPECHYPLCYDTEFGWMAVPLQIEPPTNQREPASAPSLAVGETENSPSPESPKSSKTNNHWGCWALICLFIIICLKACDSF